MNLTWHIIKKDLYQFRWSLALWLACFAYIFLVQEKVSFHGNIDLRDYFRLISILTIAVISCAMLIGIIQQDHPTDSRAFWRTRPIAPGRLVAAKLGLLLTLFVGIPLLTIMARGWLQQLVVLQTFREYSLMILVLGSITLSLAAAAACTSNIAYALLLWLGVVFGSGTLAEALDRFLPKLTLRLSQQMNMQRVITLLVFSVVISLAIILNQYLRRRFTTSVILLILGSVGSSLIGVLWSYYYFYQG